MGHPIRQQSISRLGYVVSKGIPLEEDGVLAMNDDTPMRIPWFCLIAFLGCSGALLAEIADNGWAFQPLTCPRVCGPIGPCNEDGTACEPNLMLGPKIAVLDRMGAKNDDAIFERGEWWRVAVCNWLHAGVFHWLLNMVALWNLGAPLEMEFGAWRLGLLYVLSGMFGTVVSIVFLPHVLSVGASASVFGLVGACWADVILNHCARGTTKNAGVLSLLLSTLFNLAVGLTPFVDNFMHCGGFVAGTLIGLALFTRKSQRWSFATERLQGPRCIAERHRMNCAQGTIVFVAMVALVVLGLGCVIVIWSTDAKALLRQCDWCDSINCVEISLFTDRLWWSCCVAQAPGSCALTQNSSHIVAQCNMTGLGPYTEACAVDADPSGCAYVKDDASSVAALCDRLCSQCSS